MTGLWDTEERRALRETVVAFTQREILPHLDTWEADGLQLTVSGTRLGKMPNYDEDAFVKPHYLFNSTLQYDFTDHLTASLTVKNLFDTNPVKDDTWTSYPYYNASWYDSIGRSVFMQITYKLGGEPL